MVMNIGHERLLIVELQLYNRKPDFYSMTVTHFSYSFSLQMESAASVPTFSTLISVDNSDQQVASLQGKRYYIRSLLFVMLQYQTIMTNIICCNKFKYSFK